MSLPPETITIKRKVGEENGPLPYLRVEESKRQRSDSWLYQRKQAGLESQAARPLPPNEIRPVIHTSRPSADGKGRPRPPTTAARPVLSHPPQPAVKNDGEIRSTAKPTSPPSSKPSAAGAVVEPRRFHMSRTRPQLSLSSALGGDPSAKKSRSASAVFIERGAKRKRADASPVVERLKIRKDFGLDTPGDGGGKPSPTRQTAAEGHQDHQASSDAQTAEPQRRLKRPGLAARTAKTATADATKKQGPSDTASRPKPPQLPPSLVNRRGDEDMDQLARDMDTYTLQHIGLNLERMGRPSSGEPRQQSPGSPATTPSKKYHPKAPARRYVERHPEAATPPASRPAGGEGGSVRDSDGDNPEDEEYVTETYIRIPAHTLVDSVPADQIGLLVFDTDPDIEYFYGVEEDSEDGTLEDDDDSNAEDNYRADYPDDEVDSDDEYGRNPYSYRTGNASDLEEFDGDDMADSDEESARERTEFGRFRLHASHAHPFGG